MTPLEKKPAEVIGGCGETSVLAVGLTNASSRRVTAQAIRERFERLIARELARCEALMSPHQWREHCAWVEENARCCLLEAMRTRAARGAL